MGWEEQLPSGGVEVGGPHRTGGHFKLMKHRRHLWEVRAVGAVGICCLFTVEVPDREKLG